MVTPLPTPPRIRYLNGERLIRIVAAGASWVGMRKEELNRINVFPVADGDTGTNMSLTFRAASEGIKDLADHSLPNVARALSKACVVGARGNSGMILSHFFLCFADNVGTRLKLRAPELGDILGNSTEALYSAIENPVEGTMLTVIRESMTHAKEVGHQCDDIQTLFERMTEAARASLARTPDLLPALKRANVVDSGGQGFVHFLEGILRYIHGDPIVVPHHHGRFASVEAPFLEETDLEFQYCTEVVLEVPEPLSRQELKRIFHPFGGSLIAITSGKLAKIHVHTNTPDQVFAEAANHGIVTHRKVDDMKLQSRQVLNERSQSPSSAHALPRLGGGPIAIVTDSTSDFPVQWLAERGITVVPLHVRFGTESYRDQFEMSAEQFMTKLLSSSHHPTTSQPAPQDFFEAYEKLAKLPGTKHILSIHISSGLSGTFASAQGAAKRIEGVQVHVLDSGLASVSVGMLVSRAAEMARAGKSIEEIQQHLAKLKDGSNILFTVDTLEYLHKGGRINWAAALLGTFLQFKPILTFQNGKIVTKAKVRGREALLPKVLELLDEGVPKDRDVRFCIVHSRRPEMLGILSPILKQRFKVAGIESQSIGAVVGAHIGPGAWGIAWQAE
ncbi:MAG: DegV family EDD domain-containing protein [Candidatus Wallbacteria bacterium]|nr:DegV family EDD domain-containing protein [Candidatus Wallbacteria bacterium]